MVETYGQVGLTTVMIIQTLIAPIPSEALLMFAGAILPLWDVLIFGGLGLIIGSVIAFFVARYGGRPIVIKMIGEKWVDSVDNWVSRNGAKAILFTRIVPIIPFDMISYVSGVTKMNFSDYFIATVIGSIPRILLLVYLGNIIGGILAGLGTSIDVIFVIAIVGFIILAYMERKGYIGNLENTIIGNLLKKVWK